MRVMNTVLTDSSSVLVAAISASTMPVAFALGLRRKLKLDRAGLAGLILLADLPLLLHFSNLP